MTSMVLLKHGKNNGIAVYIPKKMAAKIKLHQHFFFYLSLEGIPSQTCDSTFWAFEYWMDIV
jgi:hypothetical protein